jgi:phosphatidylserine/phosphatidylglycerophosphate/cardiolipin synthase-like enzyme
MLVLMAAVAVVGYTPSADRHRASRAVASADEIHFAPEERLDRIDVELIDNAATEIDMAAYVLSDWGIIDALNNAAARGARVRQRN